MNELRRDALKPLPEDPRDFRLGAAFQLPKLSELPAEYRLEPLAIKNQGDSDFCSAFASCAASEQQEEVLLEPAYSFAVSKQLTGDLDSWGQDLRQAMKAHVKVGAVELKDAPLNLVLKPSSFIRDIRNWPDLAEKAAIHAKSTYFDVNGPYDHFDNIRAAMWLFRAEKRAVVLGVRWGWPTTVQFINGATPSAPGHAICAIGWRTVGSEPMLVVQNSYGPEAGDKGLFYLSRDVVNAGVATFGAFMFQDMTREEYLNRIRPWAVVKLEAIKALFARIVEALLGPNAQIPLPAQPEPQPQPEPKPEQPKPDYISLWADAIQAMEGWYIGSRSFKNNNPGNLKYMGQAGTTGKDRGGFAIFKNYQLGRLALCRMLERACDGTSTVYKPTMTLTQFFSVYAPSSDGNNPKRYAEFVASKMNVPVETQIGEFKRS